MTRSWEAHVFDRIHARAPDPWDVETSPYERAKYDDTLAAIPQPHVGHALEIGCSIGAQTIRIAERCGHLLSLDIVAEAVRRTRERCAELDHVDVRQAQIPRDWPPGAFDLIVISEVLYFLSPEDIATTARAALGSLNEGGAILLVNWTGYTDTPTTGDQAAELFISASGTLTHTGSRQETYRVDVLK